jgi:hypothetical protein
MMTDEQRVIADRNMRNLLLRSRAILRWAARGARVNEIIDLGRSGRDQNNVDCSCKVCKNTAPVWEELTHHDECWVGLAYELMGDITTILRDHSAAGQGGEVAAFKQMLALRNQLITDPNADPWAESRVTAYDIDL